MRATLLKEKGLFMSRIRAGIIGKLRSQEGLSLLEFSLCILLFILLLFGIFDFGFLFYNQQVITHAGREGARLGIVARPESYKIGKAAIIQEVEFFARNNIVASGAANFIVTPTFQSGGNACSGFQDELEVEVQYTYNYIFLPISPAAIQTKTVMVCE